MSVPQLVVLENVNLEPLKPPMYVALFNAWAWLARQCPGVDLVITSAADGVHGRNSLHYVGFAVDLRIWNVPSELRQAWRDAIASACGPQFDVLLKADHMHIEFQPEHL